MVFLKSADDTVRYSITAFRHVQCIHVKFEADKTTDIKGHVKLISRVVDTHKKRLYKAILSRVQCPIRLLDVYTIFGRSFLLFFECQNQFYSVDIISSNQMP